jgi:HEAT repeat protein/sugar phosphate permease
VSEPKVLTRLDILRGLRLSTWEGVWATVWMVLTTGAFQTGFALHLGATPFVLGLLAALPAIMGLLQLPASLYVEKRGERRTFVATAALIGRLCWFPLLLIPFFLPAPWRIPAFLILLSLSSAFLTVVVPAWTSWMSDLVPETSRGQYFGRRNMIAGIVAMLVPLPAGAFLDQAVKFHRFNPSLGFSVLFGLACIAGVMCWLLLLRQPEPPMQKRAEIVNPWKSLGEPLAQPVFRAFLLFAATTVVGQSLAGQFFVAWQLDTKALHLDYLTFQLLGAVAQGGSLATMPLWGYLADKYGPRPVLALTSVGVLISPVIWIFTTPQNPLWVNIILIVVLNICAGVSWAGFGLAQFNLLLGTAPPERRATYMAVFSAATGVLGFIAPLVGGFLMERLAGSSFSLGSVVFNNYKTLFLITIAVRLLAIFFLARVPNTPDAPSARYVLGQVTRSQPMQSFKSLRRLSHPVPEAKRVEAVSTLGEIRSPLAVEELMLALEDVSLDVRTSAARALGEIKDPRAVPALAARLTDPAASIGEAVAEALGQIGSPAATTRLVEAIHGPDASVRVAALRALGKIADPGAAPALIETLQPSHPTRCEAACAALAAIGENLPPPYAPEAWERLHALLAPPIDRGMRLASARAIRALLPVFADSEGDVVYTDLLACLEAETDPAVLAQEAIALSGLGYLLHRPCLADLVALLDRIPSSGLAYKQVLEAIADAALAPGTFYPYLGMSEMNRADALQKRLRTFPLPGVLESYGAGDLTHALHLVAESHPTILTNTLATRSKPTLLELLLAVLTATTP